MKIKSFNTALFIITILGFILVYATDARAQQKLIWPLSQPLDSKIYISNYMDHNPSANQFRDYNCGTTHGYDGHLGTDIAVNSFRDSDQGVAVLAAASGIVTIVREGHFDRNTWPPYTGTGNGVWVMQDNGDYVIYWHMRKNSIAVRVGDRVTSGQFLGYVGSSGNTPIPHLHFQVNNSSQLNDAKDPYTGSCNTGESLWQQQPHYVSTEPLKVMDFGITTNHSYLGVYQNGANVALKEKLLEPVVYGMDEIKLGVWVQFQGNLNDTLKLTVTDESGEFFNEVEYKLRTKRRYGWYVYDFPFSEKTPSEGTWLITVSNGEGVIANKSFDVGDESHFSPRFYPLSGKSFQVNGQTQNYELIELGLSGEINYKLIGAPAGFTLDGNNLIIPSVSSQPYRNLNFSIAGYNSKGEKDYFKVHIVDPTKGISNFAISNQETGFWYNPISAGRGFALEVNEELGAVFLTWFTFDADINTQGEYQIGHHTQRWLSALGSYSNKNIQLDIKNISNGIFDSANTVDSTNSQQYGSISIDFEDCNHGQLTYTIHALEITGTIPIQRLFEKICLK